MSEMPDLAETSPDLSFPSALITPSGAHLPLGHAILPFCLLARRAAEANFIQSHWQRQPVTYMSMLCLFIPLLGLCLFRLYPLCAAIYACASPTIVLFEHQLQPTSWILYLAELLQPCPSSLSWGLQALAGSLQLTVAAGRPSAPLVFASASFSGTHSFLRARMLHRCDKHVHLLCLSVNASHLLCHRRDVCVCCSQPCLLPADECWNHMQT